MKSSRSLQRHRTKLRHILERAFLAALATPIAVVGVQACSGDDNVVTDAGLDASISDGGISDAGSDVIIDAGPCAPYTVQVDAQAPDGGIECGVFQVFPCGAQAIKPDATVFDDCYYSLNDCPAVCPGELFFNCHIYGSTCDAGMIVGDASGMIVECATCPNGVGRRPAGLRPLRNEGAASRVGDYFAKAAHLEAASVHAFRIMRRELVAHRAPRNLVRAAQRAEADEIRHTRMTAKLARRHGAAPMRARVTPSKLRSLEDIALENAVEGCVRETFGALFARWQSEHAEDRDVATAMKTIAADEARHAALSWSVADWAESQLSEEARVAIAQAKTKALRELEAEIDREPHPDLVKRAGLPTTQAQRAMLRVLATELRLVA